MAWRWLLEFEFGGGTLRYSTAGDIVTVTDTEAGLADAVAMVDAVRLSESFRQIVDLEILSSRLRAAA